MRGVPQACDSGSSVSGVTSNEVPVGRAAWPALVRADIRRAWSWRADIRQQVVNTDIDGLLTATLLHHLKGWPIVGLYDTETLWVCDAAAVPLDLAATLWVDVDMSWPGARSLSQHVVTAREQDAGAVRAHEETINPNLAVGCHGGSFDVYRYKYPFGTYQWAAWVAGAPSPPDAQDRLRTGLAWMADGGFMSVNHPSWRGNCLGWALSTLPNSLLAPLARQGTGAARACVEVAAARLAGGIPLPPAWRNLQYVIAQSKGGGPPTVDPATPAGVADVQSVVDEIADIHEWRRVRIPQMPRRFVGTWRTAATPPPGWPDSANRHRVFSMAITGNRKYCWTEPTNRRGLPHLGTALSG